MNLSSYNFFTDSIYFWFLMKWKYYWLRSTTFILFTYKHVSKFWIEEFYEMILHIFQICRNRKNSKKLSKTNFKVIYISNIQRFKDQWKKNVQMVMNISNWTRTHAGRSSSTNKGIVNIIISSIIFKKKWNFDIFFLFLGSCFNIQ